MRVLVSKSWITDPNKMNVPDQGTIYIGGMEYRYDGWEYCQDETDPEKYQTFKFLNLTYKDSNGTIHKGLMEEADKGSDVRMGRSIDYQGIPYYQSQMNEWVRSFAYAFNLIEQEGEDLHGDPMKDICFFQMSDEVSGENVNIKDQNNLVNQSTGKKEDIKSGDITYNDLTAKNFRLNAAIFSDSSLFATTYNTESGHNVDGNDLLFDLELIKTDRDKVNFRGCTSAEFLQCVLSDVALNAQSAKNFTANFTNVGHAIENQRLSVSGVDNDEEALDLVKFQHAFDLSSKIIQTMAEMYDRLILQTGV